MRTAHLDTIKLHKKLDAKRKHLGYSWRDVAKAIAVSPSTITRLKDYKHPSAEGLLRMLSWLGEHHHAVTLWGRRGIDRVTKAPARRLAFTSKWEALP